MVELTLFHVSHDLIRFLSLLDGIVTKTPDCTVFSGTSTVTVHCYVFQCATVWWRILRALGSSSITDHNGQDQNKRSHDQSISARLPHCASQDVLTGCALSTTSVQRSQLDAKAASCLQQYVRLERINNVTCPASIDTSSKRDVYQFLMQALGLQ